LEANAARARIKEPGLEALRGLIEAKSTCGLLDDTQEERQWVIK
jgi:hypothetical protein